MELVIITGMSGAGKTEALKCLEDLGYFAIDNLPPSLLGNLVEMPPGGEMKLDKVAAVMDVRGGIAFDEHFDALDKLQREDHDVTLFFLDATDDILVRRFSETRRIHPLHGEGLGVAETIRWERKLLGVLRERADVVLDTSETNIHELREKIPELLVTTDEERHSARISLVSFGYKYGNPLDADMIIDVRFLPNPYWSEDLRDLSGLDGEVREYVLGQNVTEGFLERFVGLLEYLLPSYQREGRAYLTVGVGCTGGRHRSVVIADEIVKRLSRKGWKLSAFHRDLDKG